MPASDYFDELETRDPAQREQALFRLLPEQIANAQKSAPAFAKILDGDRCRRDHRSRGAPAPAGDPQVGADGPPEAGLRRPRPVRRADRGADRAALRASSPRRARSTIPRRCGPITGGWRASLYAAGFRRGDVVHNTFSYHFTPAGSMLESGAHALGCPVIPGRHRQHRAAGADHRRRQARRAISARRPSSRSSSTRRARWTSSCRR